MASVYRMAGSVTYPSLHANPGPTHSALGLQPTSLLLVDVPFDTSLTSTDENSVPHG